MISNEFINRRLLTEIEYLGKKGLKAFENIVAIFTVNSTNYRFYTYKIPDDGL